MKAFLHEFRNFAVKGNMVDLAIGIIIGTAFNQVINAIVSRILMPPIALMTNVGQLADLNYVLREGTAEVEEVSIGYGQFIDVSLDFLIITLTIFFVIKLMNRLKTKAEDPGDLRVETPKNIELLSSIEKLLKEQNRLLKKSQKSG